MPASTSARRLKSALLAANAEQPDASKSLSARASLPSPTQLSVVEFCASAGEELEDECVVRPAHAHRPIEQLMCQNRKLEDRVERVLRSSMESSSLLHEVEGLLVRHDQAERIRHQQIVRESSEDPIKAMRLERCEALRVGLEAHREAIQKQSKRINDAAQSNARLQRALDGALSISKAELDAEVAMLVASDRDVNGRTSLAEQDGQHYARDPEVEAQVQRVRVAKLRLAERVMYL
ncbi:MAG: hypothetical protein SGPRY_003800 [Prymnesium sp.]